MSEQPGNWGRPDVHATDPGWDWDPDEEIDADGDVVDEDQPR